VQVEAAEADDAITHRNARENLDMRGVRFSECNPTTREGLTAILHEDDGLAAGLDDGLTGHHQARCGIPKAQGEFEQIAYNEADIVRHEDGHRRGEGVLVKDQPLRQEHTPCGKQVAGP